MKILYSFNKRGEEAAFWQREIEAASGNDVEFIAFNHDPYLDVNLYLRAQRLDDLYFRCEPGLKRLYRELADRVSAQRIDAIVVDNCPPYHPDWLRDLPVFKVLRIADGPMAAYDRDFAYIHAYDLILYHSPAYSRDMGMREKLAYVGAKQSAFLPLGLFDATFVPELPIEQLVCMPRDIDVTFVGAMHPGKMPLLAQVKKAFGRRFALHGLTSLKKNIYFNLNHGFPGWVVPIPQSAYVPLYQRTRIGINVHNRGKFTVGNYRMFELAANGVMQLSDGDEFLNTFFREGDEIVGYSNADDLISKIRHYLANDEERFRIIRNAHERVMREYRIRPLLHSAAKMIREAIG
jgi:spore maturation protein CgeB